MPYSVLRHIKRRDYFIRKKQEMLKPNLLSILTKWCWRQAKVSLHREKAKNVPAAKQCVYFLNAQEDFTTFLGCTEIPPSSNKVKVVIRGWIFVHILRPKFFKKGMPKHWRSRYSPSPLYEQRCFRTFDYFKGLKLEFTPGFIWKSSVKFFGWYRLLTSSEPDFSGKRIENLFCFHPVSCHSRVMS